MIHASHNRRGMLLLLVMGMLTLFLMMGVLLLTVATRARTSARGFMAASTNVEASPTIPRAMLDEALLLLIRGAKEGAEVTPGKPIDDILTESLLKDMYASDNNRVPYREEAFDAARHEAARSDPYLTEIEDDGEVHHAAFQTDEEFDATSENTVDNDADGVKDGVWLEGILPEMTSSGGGTLSFKVSYLVLDLDGRINVNAHGGGGPVGPASIDGSTLPAFSANGWTLIQNGGTRSSPDQAENRRLAPVLGPAGTTKIAGRGGSAYALRLDREAPRPATLTGDNLPQNPFTLGELERALRPFDPDWPTLPPRLVALLADLESSARRDVTTDSWDVTYTTGGAAPTGQAPNPDPDPELKFDLTLHAGNKQAFAEALFNFIAPPSAPNPPPRPQLVSRDQATAQWCANVAEFREPGSAAEAMTVGDHTVTGAQPSILRDDAGVWNGGFESAGDLLAIPTGTTGEIEAILEAPPPPDPPPPPLKSLVADNPSILEAVGVPSRFTATIAEDQTREPGRVNLNTCSDDIVELVIGTTPNLPKGDDRPVMHSLWDVLRLEAFRDEPTVGVPPFDEHDVRRIKGRTIANRIGSIATVRSNVFAVWITLEVTDGAATADTPTCHRLFAIVDRSIPVDYVAGENKDVRKTIRLKRFLN